MPILDHPTSPATQPPNNISTSRRKKYARKSSDTLTPWRNGLLPRHSMGDILNEHLGHLDHLHHPTPAAIQPPIASQRAVEKNTRKHPIALTPWRNGLLPGHSMGNILNQHVEHLEHQALLPTLTANRSQLPLDKTSRKHTLENPPSPSPFGLMKPFPGQQTPAPCTNTYATLLHQRALPGRAKRSLVQPQPSRHVSGSVRGGSGKLNSGDKWIPCSGRA